MNQRPVLPVTNEYGVESRIDAGRVAGWLFNGGLALLIMATGLIALFWTYQINTYTHRVNIGDPTDVTYIKGFTASVTEAGLNYRWTEGQAWLGLNYPSAPFEITFRAWASRPDNRPVEVEVVLAGQDRRRFALDDLPREYILRSRQILITPEGLEIAFRPLSTFTDEQGREVGIQLDWVEVRQASSRFGPTIPPPVVGLCWLLTGLLPLLVVRLTRLPFRSGLLLCSLTYLLLNFFYILPPLTNFLREKWLLLATFFWLGQLLLLLGLAYFLRFRQTRQTRQKEGAENQPLLKLPGPIWAFLLLIGFFLLYISLHPGRLLGWQELSGQASGFNWAQGQPAAPLDRLLPDPPAGELNLPFASQGAGYGLFSGLTYRIAQRFSRALPYFSAESVGTSGFIAYQLPFFNILIASCTIFLFYRLSRKLGNSRGTAFGASLILGAATSYAIYASSFWPDLLASLFLLYSVTGAIYYQFGKSGRTTWLLFSGVWFGLLGTIQPAYLALSPVFLIYFSLIWRQAKFSLPEFQQVFSQLGRQFVKTPQPLSFRLPAPSGAESPPTFQPGISEPPRPVEKSAPKIPFGLLISLWLLPGLAALGLALWYNGLRFGLMFQFHSSLEPQPDFLERLRQFGFWWPANPPLFLGLLALFRLTGPKYASLRFLVVGLTLVGIFCSPSPLEIHLLPFVPLWLLLATPLIEQAFSEHISLIQLTTLVAALTGLTQQLRRLLENKPAFAQSYYTETALAQFTTTFHSASWFALAAWLAFGILLYCRTLK